jgi:hypothetical protein
VVGNPYAITGVVSDGTGLASDYSVALTNGVLTVTAASISHTIGNDSHPYGSTNNLATDLGATFLTGINGENLAIAYSSLGNTAAAIVATYAITGTLSNGTGLASDYNVALTNGTLTVTLSSSPSAASIYILDPSAGGALTLSGNAGINVAGTVVVDSSSSSAILASGNARVTAAGVQVVGSVSKSGSAVVTKTGTPGGAGDPESGLPVPIANSLGLTIKSPVNLSGSSTQTIGPGVYSQITVSGNAVLKLYPGVYVITGGGITVSGNGSVSVLSSPADPITGTGAMIYNASTGYDVSTGADSGTYGAITLSGNGTISLTQPSLGTYAGILIFQARGNAKPLTFSGNAMQGISGTIYAAKAQLLESGNAQIGSSAHPVSVIVDTMMLSGNSIANVNLTAPAGTVAYTPAQIRAAYGITNVALDGKGQTIAIVDAYDDPGIYLALDAFDTQFGLTSGGPTLYSQYGPAGSFLTVLNQNGQATSLPATDPAGAGTGNWELEEALDVEWVHAMAPGAQIILVEASSESLSDLMTGVATAASQPGVSVVSMSWGFPEGQSVFAADEAAYDSYFVKPGVTFVASTGDYGAADPEYPAYSPNVVAVGGTSLYLNGDNSYNSETGWGYYSDAAGSFIGSGGGISLYQPEPAYQQGVQSTGSRTTPDVSLIADPATGAWIADTYNLDPSNPFAIVGGTSLSAPAWGGLLALVNQGRANAATPALNTSSPTETQQALYILPQTDYHSITSGTNGYSANAGYNLVTGLGTPVANLLVSDLIAYHGPNTTYSGQTVGPLQSTVLVDTGNVNVTTDNAFAVFDSFTVTSIGLSFARNPGHNTDASQPVYATPATGAAAPPTAAGLNLGAAAGSVSQSGSISAAALSTNGASASLMPLNPAGLIKTVIGQEPTPLAAPASGQTSTNQSSGHWAAFNGQWTVALGQAKHNIGSEPSVLLAGAGRTSMNSVGRVEAKSPARWVPDSALDELASDPVLANGHRAAGTTVILTLPSAGDTDPPAQAQPMTAQNSPGRTAGSRTWLTDLLLAAGFCGGGASMLTARKRRTRNLPDKWGFLKFRTR